MIARTFTRPTAPHVPTLADAIRALIPGSFHVTVGAGSVTIEAASWDGVDEQAVQDQVDAAPDDTDAVRLKHEIDNLSPLLKAAFLTLLDGLNMERARHSVAAITPAQFVTQVKAKADTL